MKKEPPINLAKCKIGQRVKLRNGEIAKISQIASPLVPYRFLLRSGLAEEDFEWVTSKGECWQDQINPLDVLALLPLPKKKAKTATHMGRKVDISENRGIDIGPAKRAIIRQAIELLTLLLKQ